MPRPAYLSSPTAVIAAGQSETLTLPSFEGADVIVKPAVSAGAVGVGKFASGSAQAHAHLSSILESGNDALVQPFVSDVVDGERSIIHIGGRYSHAVRKIPAANDFRVQEFHGGTNHLHQPSAAELAVADAALAATPPCGPPANCFMHVWTSWARWINHCSWKWN